MRQFTTFLITAAVLFAACSGSTKGPEVKTAPALEEATADSGQSKLQMALASDKDPVCGMPVTSSDMVSDTAMYDGKIYGFCSPDCKKEFLKNPLSYLN